MKALLDALQPVEKTSTLPFDPQNVPLYGVQLFAERNELLVVIEKRLLDLRHIGLKFFKNLKIAGQVLNYHRR